MSVCELVLKKVVLKEHETAALMVFSKDAQQAVSKENVEAGLLVEMKEQQMDAEKLAYLRADDQVGQKAALTVAEMGLETECVTADRMDSMLV